VRETRKETGVVTRVQAVVAVEAVPIEGGVEVVIAVKGKEKDQHMSKLQFYHNHLKFQVIAIFLNLVIIVNEIMKEQIIGELLHLTTLSWSAIYPFMWLKTRYVTCS